MSDYIIHGSSLEDIADAIREKTGTSSPIAVGDMPDIISSISGGDGHELYTVDDLLINTNYTVTSGTANVTKQYALNQSIENYDAVVVMGWCYNTGTQQANLISSVIFAKDYYQRSINAGDSTPWILNASTNSVRRTIVFQFDDATHITTISIRTESGVEPVLYKVEGVKFGRDVDHKEETLWSGNLTAVGDVTLSDSIQNYDEINIKWHCNQNSGAYTKYIKVLVEDIDYTRSAQFCDSAQISSAGANYTAFISCYFKNATTFNLTEKYNGSSFTPVIDEIIGIKYGGFNANTPFEMEQVFQESPTVTLTNNTLNTVKTMTIEDEGYYFLSFVDEYQRSSNRSYLVVSGIQNECLIYNFGSHSGTDVLGDPSGYSWFAHTIMFRTFVPNTTVTLGLWGNGYNPSLVKITLYKMKGMFNGGEVVANPVGEPTDELNTIQIGNTIYEIAGGSKTLEEKVLVGSTVTATGSGSSSTSVDKQNVIRAKLELWLWCPNVDQAGTVNIIINNEPHLVTEYTYYTYTDQYHAVRTYILDLDEVDVTQVGYSFSGLAYNSASQFHGEITLTWQEQATPKLSQLSDVDINDIQDGQILKWNLTSQKFENANDGGGNSWTGTQAELEEVFDELEDGTQINITDDEAKISANGDIYSLDEQCIGLWIDNKPLYQKTITFGTIPVNTSNYQLTLGLDNVDKIVELEITAYKDNAYIKLPLPLLQSTSIYAQYGINVQAYDKSTDKLRIDTGSDRSLDGGYVTVKYTKSIDAPLDGIMPGANTMYIASSDCYSADEKEIGCWINGKPLYQRTINIGMLSKDTNWHYIDLDFETEIIVDISPIFHLATSNSDTYYNMPNYRPALSNMGISFFVGDGQIGYMNNWLDVAGNTGEAYVTLKYTKPNDVAGSGRFVPSGDKAQHYSSEEQVIGTWTDGSTLYQRTFRVAVNSVGQNVITLWNATNIQIKDFNGCFVFRASENVAALYCRPTDANYKLLVYTVGCSEQYGVYAEVDLGTQRGNAVDLMLTLKYIKVTS